MRRPSSARAKIIGYGTTGWNVELKDGSVQLGIPSLIPDWRVGQWVTMIRSGNSWTIIGVAVNAPNGVNGFTA